MNIAALGTAELEAELIGLAGHLAAAQCRFLLLLAEFDTRDAWSGPGLRSCAHWLSWRIGMDLRTAREQLRVARALVRLPQVSAAFGAGRISFAKARAITRIATPLTEGDLLEVALAGTASHLERVVRLAPQRGSRYRRGGIGSASEQAPGTVLDRVAARRADALVALAEAARQSGTGDGTRSVSEAFEVMVHVHADSGTAEIEGGPALPISAAQRLACQARVSALIKDRSGNPLYLVGAAAWSHRGCSAPSGPGTTDDAGSPGAPTSTSKRITSCRG